MRSLVRTEVQALQKHHFCVEDFLMRASTSFQGIAFDLSDPLPDLASPLWAKLDRFGVETVAQGLHGRLLFFLGQGQGVLEDLLGR